MEKYKNEHEKYKSDIEKTEKIIQIMRNMINQCRALKLPEFEQQLLGQIEHNVNLKATLEIAKENLESCDLYEVKWNKEKEDFEQIYMYKIIGETK